MSLKEKQDNYDNYFIQILVKQTYVLLFIYFKCNNTALHAQCYNCYSNFSNEMRFLWTGQTPISAIFIIIILLTLVKIILIIHIVNIIPSNNTKIHPIMFQFCVQRNVKIKK